jgi:ankyrin repeat protein
LPDNPSLERLRKQAKTLLQYVRAGVPDAIELVAEFHPRPPEVLKLSDAQLVTARMYGFASWPRLKRHIDIVAEYSRSPHQVAASDHLPDEFLRLACLTYGADYPGRTRDADLMLTRNPQLATANVFTMAATGSADALAGALAAEPGLARRPGGPFGWEPLLYLTYARLDVPGRYLDSARLLLEHGADPNAGFLWDGLTSPFTALTGAFGGGEGDQPEHPQGLPLARLLLRAGADPNDAQALYNRGLGGSFADDTAHLELLLEFGLGRGDGGPWHARLGPTLQSPRRLMRDELATAALRGGPRRARLLLAYGAEVDGIGGHPAYGGRTPYELALLNGHTEVADLLAAAGASAELDEQEAFTAACMRADADAVARLGPQPLATVLSRLPGLINHAAEHRNTAAVRLLASLGFDVNHRGRATPLHEAAWNDDVETLRALIELGADPSITDADHYATPLGWAEYGGKHQAERYLRGLGERELRPSPRPRRRTQTCRKVCATTTESMFPLTHGQRRPPMPGGAAVPDHRTRELAFQSGGCRLDDSAGGTARPAHRSRPALWRPRDLKLEPDGYTRHLYQELHY